MDNLDNRIAALFDKINNAPDATAAASVVVSEVAECIGVYRQDPDTLEALAKMLTETSGQLGEALAAK